MNYSLTQFVKEAQPNNDMKKSISYIWIDAFDYNHLLLKGEIFENENTRRNY